MTPDRFTQLFRGITLLLLGVFLFGTMPLHPGASVRAPESDTSLAFVIQKLQDFSTFASSREASDDMRAVVVAFQSASGILMPAAQGHQDQADCIVVIIKLPFLHQEASELQHRVRQGLLDDDEWAHLYSSPEFTPPAPPPLAIG